MQRPASIDGMSVILLDNPNNPIEVPLAMLLDRSVSVSTLKGLPKEEAIWGFDFSRMYFQ